MNRGGKYMLPENLNAFFKGKASVPDVIAAGAVNPDRDKTK
jgi:hypothetical protein